MNPRVVDVKPEKNYTLHVWFKNGEEYAINNPTAKVKR